MKTNFVFRFIKMCFTLFFSVFLIFLSSSCGTEPQTTQPQSNVEKALNDPAFAGMKEASSDMVLGGDFSPDAKLIATGGFDKAVTLWEVSPKNQLHQLRGHDRPVYVVSYSPDGKTLASSDGRVIKFWDVVNKKELKEVKGNCELVSFLTFSRDGKTLVSTCGDVIEVWDVEGKKERRTFSLRGDKPLAISPNGKLLAFKGSSYSIILSEIESGKELFNLKGHTTSIYAIKFSPDGKILASGSGDKKIKLWNVSDGKEIQTLTQLNTVLDIAFSPDSKKIAVSGENFTKIWNISDGKELLELPSNYGLIYKIAFSSNGKSLVGMSRKKDIIVWDTTSGKVLNGDKK